MPDETILVYGADWCFDCRRTKRFLSQNNVTFDWIDIERSKDGEQVVLKVNRGMRSIPTLVFGDGSVLIEPSNAELAGKLGIPS